MMQPMTTPTPAPVALVTGSARRLGAAIARGAACGGLRRRAALRTLARGCRSLAASLEATRAGSTLVLQADLTSSTVCRNSSRTTIGRFGRLDALVNNASAFFPTPIGEATPAQFDALFGANSARALLPRAGRGAAPACDPRRDRQPRRHLRRTPAARSTRCMA
jgi:pteridine reductase